MATTILFFRFAMQHEDFRGGDFTTHFVDEEFGPEVLQIDDPERYELAALTPRFTTAPGRRTTHPKLPPLLCRKRQNKTSEVFAARSRIGILAETTRKPF